MGGGTVVDNQSPVIKWKFIDGWESGPKTCRYIEGSFWPNFSQVSQAVVEEMSKYRNSPEISGQHTQKCQEKYEK